MRLLEIVQLSLFVWMLIPVFEAAAVKKSKILLLLTTLPLFDLAAVPRVITALLGRLTPAGPMLLFATVLLLFPATAVDVLKNTVPPAVPTADVDAPRIVQLAMMSFCAPLIRRIVLVPAVADAVVVEMVSWL